MLIYEALFVDSFKSQAFFTFKEEIYSRMF